MVTFLKISRMLLSLQYTKRKVVRQSVATTEESRCYVRSEEHTSELQSLAYLVCRLLLEKKKKISTNEGQSPSASVSCTLVYEQRIVVDRFWCLYVIPTPSTTLSIPAPSMLRSLVGAQDMAI